METQAAPAITLAKVESSQIDSIGYDPATSTLAIRFKSRDKPLYYYDNVTPEDWDAFENAESIGSHFYKHIKPYDKKFPYRKISEQPTE
ncbi:KTSC domain-containing protein [Paraburkholderia sp.]|uniref:KTSC domain-containing protein n=1 Tax=Paraburkholderia sp. TaxID=1926495 RepID=UPI003C7ABB40